MASVYSKELNSTSGRESIDVRMVIGALIITHKLNLDDRGTVAMISENIYLQYFCDLTNFQTKEPFHPTVQLNAYQKRKQKKERNQRNLIEGKFGQAKNAYELSKIQVKTSDTSQS